MQSIEQIRNVFVTVVLIDAGELRCVDRDGAFHTGGTNRSYLSSITHPKIFDDFLVGVGKLPPRTERVVLIDVFFEAARQEKLGERR